MKKYSVLFAALLALTAVVACQKKEAPKPAAAPAADAAAALLLLRLRRLLPRPRSNSGHPVLRSTGTY